MFDDEPRITDYDRQLAKAVRMGDLALADELIFMMHRDCALDQNEVELGWSEAANAERQRKLDLPRAA